MKTFTTLAVASATLLSLVNGSAIVKRTPAIQPSCTDFTPFTYSGCYSDAGDPKPALVYRATSLDSQRTTIQQCVAFCKGNNWRYAGLEYYGICFCGNSVTGQILPDEQCDTPCKANETQACGGNSKISIYQDPTFIPVEDTSIADYMSVGCYSEGPNGRTLYWQQDDVDADNLDVNQCLSACRDEGYPFAGVEYGRECFCGNVLANGTQLLDAGRCDFPCSGDPTQTCGGAGALNLYVAKDLDTREPCKDGLPVPPVSVPTISITTTVASSTTSSPLATTTSSSAPSSSSSSTTSKGVSSTTSKPATTVTTTTTSKSSLCTSVSTSVPVPSCEYKVGKWCSSPLPPYTDKNSCKLAAGNCLIQFATCFLTAGFPESLKCLQFKAWCLNVNTFCGNQCPGPNCSHSSCKQKYPPVSPPQPTPVVSTSIGPCATTTTAKASTTTRAVTTTSSVPVPQPTDCLCEQPHNPAKGYTRDDSLGDVDLTCVACNDDKNDWKSGNYFKLYNNPDSRKCGGYNKPVEACKQACADQYKGCVNYYAESCKNNSRKLARTYGPSKNYGKRYDDAMEACKCQYNDCLKVNSKKTAGGQCSTFNKLKM